MIMKPERYLILKHTTYMLVLLSDALTKQVFSVKTAVQSDNKITHLEIYLSHHTQ